MLSLVQKVQFSVEEEGSPVLWGLSRFSNGQFKLSSGVRDIIPSLLSEGGAGVVRSRDNVTVVEILLKRLENDPSGDEQELIKLTLRGILGYTELPAIRAWLAEEQNNKTFASPSDATRRTPTSASTHTPHAPTSASIPTGDAINSTITLKCLNPARTPSSAARKSASVLRLIKPLIATNELTPSPSVNPSNAVVTFDPGHRVLGRPRSDSASGDENHPQPPSEIIITYTVETTNSGNIQDATFRDSRKDGPVQSILPTSGRNKAARVAAVLALLSDQATITTVPERREAPVVNDLVTLLLSDFVEDLALRTTYRLYVDSAGASRYREFTRDGREKLRKFYATQASATAVAVVPDSTKENITASGGYFTRGTGKRSRGDEQEPSRASISTQPRTVSDSDNGENNARASPVTPSPQQYKRRIGVVGRNTSRSSHGTPVNEISVSTENVLTDSTGKTLHLSADIIR
jgi:hypothetical protein